ncbi:MAG: WecB/TagA/CpsF family glycosyltransferase [Gammaproteobacteria bacterium]|nr:WecB/TagA/CpsF family glycosyltransferase [Gammaproteobacteria bacterium]
MMSPERIELLGVPVDCVDMGQSLEAVDALIQGDCAKTVIAVNPEKIIKARTDTKLLRLLQQSGLLIPDGIGAVIAVKILHGKSISRVPGSELMPEICRRSISKGYKLFLLGAAPEVNEKAVEVLKEKYQGINIVGSQHGYYSDDEIPALIDQINDSEADVLFVALGSPRQELWMEEYLPKLNVKVCQGVGGTFDVIAGKVKRAPALFLKMHMEWLYRLLAQPKRLLRQTALPKFVYLVFKQKLFG